MRNRTSEMKKLKCTWFENIYYVYLTAFYNVSTQGKLHIWLSPALQPVGQIISGCFYSPRNTVSQKQFISRCIPLGRKQHIRHFVFDAVSHSSETVYQAHCIPRCIPLGRKQHVRHFVFDAVSQSLETVYQAHRIPHCIPLRRKQHIRHFVFDAVSHSSETVYQAHCIPRCILLRGKQHIRHIVFRAVSHSAEDNISGTLYSALCFMMR